MYRQDRVCFRLGFQSLAKARGRGARRWARPVSCLAGAALAVLLMAPGLSAEPLRLNGSSKSRNALFASQAALLDGKLAKQYSGSVKLTPSYKTAKAAGKDVAVASDEVMPRYNGRYKGQYLEHARSVARKHGVPEELFLRLVQRESGWNAQAVSQKGATGLAQLMPGTAKLLGVDIADPKQNLEGGARYLKMMHSKFGSWRLALAAYNAGPAAVEQHGGVPPFAETKAYVLAILE